ncbi:MAG: alkaline phosphatase family protein [Tepidibacillus sp.]
MKKIIMILIDALMPEALENAIKTQKTPALKFLMEHSTYISECVTAFPTMTASVDSTLMTGVYPDQHKVPGLIWYHPEEKRIVNYVNGARTVLKYGLIKTAKDVLVHLNESHLNKKTKTIYEELADHSKTSGAINFIIHRGKSEHHLKPPFLINLFTLFSFNNRKISGPNILSLGAIHKPAFFGRTMVWNWNQSVFQQFGINDDFAAEATKLVIQSGNQPDFLMVYFPDHDHFLHKHIHQPLASLEKVDQKLTKILNVFGSWDQALQQTTFIIIGDHGQTAIGKEQHHNIDLDQLLKPFKVTPVGKKISETDEVVFANNERMVYVYPLKKDKREQVIKTLLSDDRIDFVAWKEKDQIHVKNHQGKELHFTKQGKKIDPYGVGWNVDGDLSLLDIKIENGAIYFNQYPDALSRLYGALFSQEIFSIVATAKPSFEFISKTFPVHLGGGSHGSLHRTDSIVPLLVSGATKNPKPNTRIVDLKDYVLDLLNVTSTTTG